MSGTDRLSRHAVELLPRQKAQDGPLIFMMTIMSCLAGLVLILTAMSSRALSQWHSDIADKVTVTLNITDISQREDLVAQAQDMLRARPEITTVTLIDESRAKALLKPWIGDVALPADLPIPVILTVQTRRDHILDIEAIKEDLAFENMRVDIDTHSAWRAEMKRNRRTLSGALWVILILILSASIAVSIFATQSRLHTHEKIISVLSQVGAKKFYIARLFIGQFFLRGLVAGLMGCGLSLLLTLLYLLLQGDTPMFGHSFVSGSDIFRLLILGVGFGVICAATAGATSLSRLKISERNW